MNKYQYKVQGVDYEVEIPDKTFTNTFLIVMIAQTFISQNENI